MTEKIQEICQGKILWMNEYSFSLYGNLEGVTVRCDKDFLIQAARRHNVFNYRNIAEYYAHATPEMQRLMEESALVIIDVDDAIANGYATLNADVLNIMEDDDA